MVLSQNCSSGAGRPKPVMLKAQAQTRFYNSKNLKNENSKNEPRQHTGKVEQGRNEADYGW